MQADISLFELFWHASLLVQGVMLLLLIISMTSWTLIFQRGMVIKKASKIFHEFEHKFHLGHDLNRLYDYIASKRERSEGLENIFKAGFREFLRLNKKETMSPKVVMENTERAMRVALAQEEDQLEKHLSFLASVGSISVYVGLFGTVWGIMTAFRALGSMQQATLAMVAPGISEALVATALGLFAAIPAVFAYNRYTQHVQSLLRKYDNVLDEFTGLLQRQIYLKHHADSEREERD
ncbi:MAG TPA: protein TolQ [Gammaproteobacteria bacterium]|nr:protein TolQ [Gammaproteobacteria bacterium]